MPNKFIYKGGDLDPSQSVARAAIAHFTKYGVFKVAQDGLTQQAIGLDDVQAITGNLTLVPKDSGKVIMCNAAAGNTITLPKASYGKMRFRVVLMVDVTSNQVRLTPDAADTFKGNRLSKTAGQNLDSGNATDAAGDFVEIISDGTTNWYISAVKGTWA